MLYTTAIITSNTIRTQTGAAERWSSGRDSNSCYVSWTRYCTALFQHKKLQIRGSKVTVAAESLQSSIVRVMWTKLKACSQHMNWTKLTWHKSTQLQVALIGNDSVPIQLAQCRFLWLAVFNAKIWIHIIPVKYTEAILSKSTRKLLWFEITKNSDCS